MSGSNSLDCGLHGTVISYIAEADGWHVYNYGENSGFEFEGTSAQEEHLQSFSHLQLQRELRQARPNTDQSGALTLHHMCNQACRRQR
jgi:hypothetical protein